MTAQVWCLEASKQMLYLQVSFVLWKHYWRQTQLKSSMKSKARVGCHQQRFGKQLDERYQGYSGRGRQVQTARSVECNTISFREGDVSTRSRFNQDLFYKLKRSRPGGYQVLIRILGAWCWVSYHVSTVRIMMVKNKMENPRDTTRCQRIASESLVR